ncbi:Transducin/WD40 repeat-like superfamily protein [Prunus dulcis]|uniref:Transducin/WD40 repeat-like superfamily protein n=1 Tax=Prunus dulcis TaxID=3755 RepID=A0A4Y1RGJ9_PRUDU|nr:Transducin/WD40 repeat-like superfamily protein [Prunus dulcis]
MKHASLSPSHRRCSAQPPPDALHRRIRWLHHLEIVPMAMLCGHAAPIADLGICDPLVVSGSEGRDSLGDGDGEVSSSPHSHGALISACADGMLCVWSRSSGHCRRRRKLPPWVGSPSMVRTLPSNQRYFMDVVSLTEDQEKHAVVMADSFGRLQLVSIPKNPHQDKEGGTGLHPSSQLEMTVCAEGLSEGGNVMSIATCGNVVAFVLKSRCIFRLLPSGNTIGEISSVDDLLCEKSDSTQSHMCESLCEIPANTHPLDVRLSISFIQMGHYILRIESLCFDAEEPLQWKPHVTIWSTCRKHDDHGNLCLWFKLHGVGCSLVDWTANSTSSNESECPGDMETKLTSSKSFGSSSGSVNGYDNDNLGLVNKRGVVSSSMVISETFFAPYAVVYGFFTGEIEIVRFDLFEGLSSLGGSSHHEVKPQISRQFFLGHTGAVLCLAAHRMVGIAKGWSFNQVLVSGSMDCTVRIWDLDTGNLITVMHQHVGPVRQIILPPAHTYRPWSDCFLSVGEDSCVALASLETLRVERIFPGHPSYPAKVVWDGGRGYIVCLCRNHSGTSDAVDILYIWDVKTGARERVLRGTPSHSMFDHFCKGISMNSISGSVLNGNTSVSSLLLPVIEDGISTHSHPNNSEKLGASTNLVPGTMVESNTSRISKGDSEKLFPAPAATLQSNKHPIKSYCPFPGIAALSFDLASLVFPYQKHDLIASGSDNKQDNYVKGQGSETSSPHHKPLGNGPGVHRTSNAIVEEIEWIKTLEECLLRFSLASLHLWNVDPELDNLLITDMKLKRPKSFIVASGFQGDKGSLTLTFPNLSATLELWRMSSEFCAMRSLTMVSLAQRMISLSHTSSNASSALAAFYTRNFADKMPDIKPPLLQLVMAMNEKYSSTAAELLAEDRVCKWSICQLGCTKFSCTGWPSGDIGRFLLPSLAVADVPGFLTVMESQIWSTASDSPVHLVSLMTLIRVVRGSPRYLAQYLDKVIDFILQTVDPSNSVMRNTCFQSSMTALKEVVRAFPMVALNDTWTRLAVGDVIGERNNATIRIYDMQSVMKIKVLDASGPPGLPNLLAAGSEMMLITAISALSFSPDGEGLVAFSEHGLMIRWWSLGSVFWEKLSRNLVPVQCTKLIFVPPWEGFSPNSSRSSIMASIMGHDRQINIQEGTKGLSQADNLKLLIHNLDLSYRLEWVGERKVLLTRHGHELGTFLLLDLGDLSCTEY